MTRLATRLIVFTCAFTLGWGLVGMRGYSCDRRSPRRTSGGLCEGAAYSYGYYFEPSSAPLASRQVYTRCEDVGGEEGAVKMLRNAAGGGQVLWQEAVTNPAGRPIGSQVVVAFGTRYAVMWTEGGVYRRVDAFSLGAALDGAKAISECARGCPPSA